MKIAIPVDENNMESKISVSFGRTPYFLIYDTESKESKFIYNTAQSDIGGAGVKAGQLLVDEKVDVLIAPRCGGNADTVLLAGGVKMFKSKSDIIEENITAFLNNELEVLNKSESGFGKS